MVSVNGLAIGAGGAVNRAVGKGEGGRTLPSQGSRRQHRGHAFQGANDFRSVAVAGLRGGKHASVQRLKNSEVLETSEVFKDATKRIYINRRRIFNFWKYFFC